MYSTVREDNCVTGLQFGHYLASLIFYTIRNNALSYYFIQEFTVKHAMYDNS